MGWLSFAGRCRSWCSLGVAAAVVRAVRGVPFAQYVAKRERAEPRTPLSEMEWFLVAIILACLLARTMASLMTPMNDWDGICVWGLKAKVLFFETIRTTGYFNRHELSYSHPIYPLLVPLMYAWVATVIGHWDDVGIFIVNPVNVIVATALLYCVLRRQTSRMSSLAITAIFASLPGDYELRRVRSGRCAPDASQCRIALLSVRLDAITTIAIPLVGRVSDRWGDVHEGRGEDYSRSAHDDYRVVDSDCGGAPGERKKLFGHLGLYLLIAGIWILPWLVFQRRFPLGRSNSAPCHLAIFAGRRLPTLIHAIVAERAAFLQ